MDKNGIRFFKCYAMDNSCIDCEYRESCNVFVYIKQQINSKPKKSDNSSFIQDCYNDKCPHYHKAKMCKKYLNTADCSSRISSPK